MWRREAETVKQLQQLGKPFVMLLNSFLPTTRRRKKLAERLEETYHCAVIPVNCEQLKRRISTAFWKNCSMSSRVTRINF